MEKILNYNLASVRIDASSFFICSMCGIMFVIQYFRSFTVLVLNKICILQSSFLSALPYFAQWVLGNVFSPIADMIIVKNIVSVGTSRKLFNSIGG